MFFKGSRYENVASDSITNADGRTVIFKKTRLIPDTPASAAVLVGQGERLDQLAQRIYQNPELFWLICDANRATWPDALVEDVSRTLLIPASEG